MTLQISFRRDNDPAGAQLCRPPDPAHARAHVAIACCHCATTLLATMCLSCKLVSNMQSLWLLPPLHPKGGQTSERRLSSQQPPSPPVAAWPLRGTSKARSKPPLWAAQSEQERDFGALFTAPIGQEISFTIPTPILVSPPPPPDHPSFPTNKPLEAPYPPKPQHFHLIIPPRTSLSPPCHRIDR